MADIVLPKSSSTVSVKAFNIGTPDASIPSALFIAPVKPGKEQLFATIYAFLVEHSTSGRKILFDLGLRKDVEKVPPALQGLLSQTKVELKVDADITDQLKAGGVSLNEIDTVVWSHSHFDHTGDMSLFPPTTKLLIGKGTDRRTYPSVPDANLLDSDYAGREVVELSWENSNFSIGECPAYDFFGDGSFYLLDTPGHWPGHLTGLARVKENDFVLLGGDTCHHVGQIRPNPHLHKYFPCPAGLLSDLSKPVLTIPEGPSLYADRSTSLVSQEKIGRLDAHPDIFLIASHDVTLDGLITLFPETVDNWKELGWKSKAVWAFLDEGNKGFGYH